MAFGEAPSGPRFDPSSRKLSAAKLSGTSIEQVEHSKEGFQCPIRRAVSPSAFCVAVFLGVLAVAKFSEAPTFKSVTIALLASAIVAYGFYSSPDVTAQGGTEEPFPDWPIHELFFYLCPRILEEPHLSYWEVIGRKLSRRGEPRPRRVAEGQGGLEAIITWYCYAIWPRTALYGRRSPSRKLQQISLGYKGGYAFKADAGEVILEDRFGGGRFEDLQILERELSPIIAVIRTWGESVGDVANETRANPEPLQGA